MMQRVVPGVLLAGGWLLLLLSGSVGLFHLVVVVVVAIGADEYVRLSRHAGGEPEKRLPHRLFHDLLLVVPVVVSLWSPTPVAVAAVLPALFFLLTAERVFSFEQERAAAGCAELSRLFFGVFYVGGLASHIVLLRHIPHGADWILVATAITAGSDSGAWFCGRRWGRHRLCPAVSPKKTVEGAVGGILCATVAAVCSGILLFESPSIALLCAAALLLAVAGMFGDLCESILKRGAGIKDSGSLLGGHGGVLDRIDSLLFAIPVLYWLLFLFPSLR